MDPPFQVGSTSNDGYAKPLSPAADRKVQVAGVDSFAGTMVRPDSNKIFLGCNYSNKKVKRHFEELKKKWEAELPVRVVLIDKQRAKGARDLWQEIQREVESSSLGIFDVSAFRPNVVLELGYALAVKDEESIIISFDERKPRKSHSAKWELSDIGHLNQVRYKHLETLDALLTENLVKVPAIAGFRALAADARSSTNAPEKYEEAALKVLHALRDSGSLTDQQFRGLIRGAAIREKTLGRLLKRHRLARRSQGRNGRWTLVTEQ